MNLLGFDVGTTGGEAGLIPGAIMFGRRSVLVQEALCVHAVVQAAVSRGDHQAHALVSLIVGASADRVQEGQGSLDLLEEGDRVEGGEVR